MYISFMFSMDDLHEQIYKDRKTKTPTYLLVYKRKDIEKIKKKKIRIHRTKVQIGNGWTI